VAGGISASQQNKQRKQQLAQAGSVPQGYDPEQAYEDGVKLDYKWAPLFAAQEEKLRAQYLPGRANQAAEIYKQMLPKIAGANMAALKAVDPEFVGARKKLYGNVTRDLDLGYALDPAYAAQVQEYIRGAQAARGNVLGAGPIGAEALYKGKAAVDMYQQRLGNVADFIRAPGPTDKFSGLVGAGGPAIGAASSAPTAPGFQFVDRNAGSDGVARAQQQYQNTFGAWRTGAAMTAEAGPAANPWMAALGGAVGSVGGAVSAYQAFKPAPKTGAAIG
jgi:hypothetical protein